MSERVLSFPVSQYIIRIDECQYCENPRELLPVGSMVCFHNRYGSLGDAHDYRVEDHQSWEELRKHILKDNPNAVILPLFLFDHSGKNISTTDEQFRLVDPQGWDWGQVGFVFVSLETAREEYGFGRITKARREWLADMLRAEVEEYSCYLRGEVYSYIIENSNGEEVESKSGILGYVNALNEAMSEVAAL